MSLTKIQENTIESYAKWAMRSDNTARVMAPTEKYALRFAEKHGLSLPDLFQKLESAGLLLPVTHFALSQLSAEKTHGDNENLVDEYLRRRGWRETLAGRQALQAMRDARLSVFEVLGGKDSISLTVRDLMGDATPITVSTPHVRYIELLHQGLAGRLANLNGVITFILTPLTIPVEYLSVMTDAWQKLSEDERTDDQLGTIIVSEFLESLWAQADEGE